MKDNEIVCQRFKRILQFSRPFPSRKDLIGATLNPKEMVTYFSVMKRIVARQTNDKMKQKELLKTDYETIH
jgi:hypothetical protein